LIDLQAAILLAPAVVALLGDIRLLARDGDALALGKLVAPERRRQAVDGIRAKYGLSERHACRIVGQHRGTQRYVPTLPADEDGLTRAIGTRSLPTCHPSACSRAVTRR
jgi:hypothetical protein